MRTIKAQSGFMVIAQNGPHGDYLRMAYGLALSLRRSQSIPALVSVMVTPGMIVPEAWRDVFDEVIEIPWGDDAQDSPWKIHNKWKVYANSPYEETIFLDADMIVPCDLARWWASLRHHDVILTPTAYRYDGDVIKDSAYRETFRNAKLPDVYTTFCYFRQTDRATAFFDLLRQVFQNWEQVRETFPTLPVRISGDLAFAVAARLFELDTRANPLLRFVHMKMQVLRYHYPGEDWTRVIPAYLRPDTSLLVGNYIQTMPFHYAVKEFLTDDMLEALGGHLG